MWPVIRTAEHCVWVYGELDMGRGFCVMNEVWGPVQVGSTALFEAKGCEFDPWRAAACHTVGPCTTLDNIRTIPEICGERNTVRSCDPYLITLDQRMALARSSATICPVLIVRDRAWYHMMEQRSSHCEFRGWFFFFLFFLYRVEEGSICLFGHQC